jgi:hypothetical protein
MSAAVLKILVASYELRVAGSIRHQPYPRIMLGLHRNVEQFFCL